MKLHIGSIGVARNDDVVLFILQLNEVMQAGILKNLLETQTILNSELDSPTAVSAWVNKKVRGDFRR